MPRATTSRKQRFRAALALAGMTGKQFAEKLGITNGHLWQVVSGVRESDTLTAQVDAFITKHLVSTNALVA